MEGGKKFMVDMAIRTLSQHDLLDTPHRAEELPDASQTGRLHPLGVAAAQFEVLTEYPNQDPKIPIIARVEIPTENPSHDSEAATALPANADQSIQGTGHAAQNPILIDQLQSLPAAAQSNSFQREYNSQSNGQFERTHRKHELG